MLYLYIGLGIVGFLLLGFLISLLIVTPLCYRKFFHRRELTAQPFTDGHYAPFRETMLDARARMEALPYEERKCTSYDGTELYARYYDFGKAKTIIFMHGVFTEPLNNFAVHAERFIGWGFNVLIPDQRAHGKSGGDQVTYGHRERHDLLAWIESEHTRTGAEIALYGTSMGAATVAMASDIVPEYVRVAVCDCGFSSILSIMKYCTKRYHAPSALFGLLKGTCRRRLNIDIGESCGAHLKNSKLPVLFIHGTEDAAAPPKDSEDNYRACTSPKELVMVEGCGHTTAAVADEPAQKVYNFIKKYI